MVGKFTSLKVIYYFKLTNMCENINSYKNKTVIILKLINDFAKEVKLINVGMWG